VTLGIVTISFNQARFLPEAIESVQLRDRSRLRYVVVDAGSRDGSREVIARYRERFAAVILEPDQGPADGLNQGFAVCGGDVLGYLNSDDRFTPGALDFVLDYFERHSHVDVLLGAVRIVDEHGRPHRRGRAVDRLDLRKFAYETCFVWQQATFFRRECFERVGGFNAANRIAWDSELVVDMALAGARVGYTPHALGDFRMYGESITGSGRMAQLGKQELARVRRKILQSGVPPMSAWEELVARAAYKFNPVRHWRSSLLRPPRT
jgi:glycosyltransferase involved in cell wall biosynthesis